jgi:hypothetical protein
LGVERWTDSPTLEKSLVTKTNRVKTGLMEGRQLGETRNRSLWRRNEFYLLWEDGVEEDVARLGRTSWTEVALNREGWRKLLKEAEAHPGL